MVDVVFLLIIFFMVSTTFITLESGLPVELPDSQTTVTEPSNLPTVTINKDGAIFFGATTVTDRLLHDLPGRALVLDFADVLYMDSTGADALKGVLRSCTEQGLAVLVSGLAAQPLDMARRTGMLALLVHPPSPDLDHAAAMATQVAPDHS